MEQTNNTEKLINYGAIWRFVNAKDEAAKMAINNTYYVVHYGGEAYLSGNDRNEAPIYEHLCSFVDQARRFRSWAEAEETIRQLRAAEESNNIADDLKFDCWVERIDDRLPISKIVDDFELFFVDGETREDGVDRISSHFLGANDAPDYLRECKAAICRYFRLVAVADKAWDSMTDDDLAALREYNLRLADAHNAKVELSKKASKTN